MFDLSWLDSGAIAVVRLNRPPANAIGLDQVRELDSLIDRLHDTPCRAVLFHAEGRFFSAGADIGLMGKADGSADAATPQRMARDMQRVYAKLESLAVPTICAIAGICVGGGMELALSCDIRVATRDARFGLPESRIGLLPGAGGTQRLVAVAGIAVAKRLILTGEIISGELAQRYGIVQDLVETGRAYDHALTLARAIAATPTRTIAAIARCIALAPSPAGYEAELEESAALHDQPETKALIDAFAARSKAKKAAAP